MNTQDRIAGFDLTELNRLHAEARGRARELRSEAIAEFWRGAFALPRAWWSSVQRVGTPLRQHRPLRAAAPAGTASR